MSDRPAPTPVASGPTTMGATTMGAATAGSLILLMALTALGQMATNVVVPSLGLIVGELALKAESAGLVISMVLLGLALGQLVVGPLSDRVGRRPVLLAGLAVYVLGSLAATFAPNGGLLLLARLVQGLGASTGLALPRAIARDRYAGPHFLRAMSLLTLAMAVMPGLAPIMGGAVSGSYGWRASLALSVMAGLGVMLAAILALPESHHHRPSGGGLSATLATTLSSYAHVLRGKVFLAYALGTSAVVGGAYAEVAGAQRLFAGAYGWTTTQVSLAPACYAGAFLVAGLLGPRLGGGLRRRLWIGIGILLASPALLLLLQATGLANAWASLGLIMASQMGVGLLLPAAIGLALMSVEGAAGTASAVMGALHMVVGAIGAALINAWAGPVGWTMPALMLGFAVLAAVAQRIALAGK